MSANPNPQPKAAERRLLDRLATQAAGKSLQIVVAGNCKVCRHRSSTVPATKSQALAWFRDGDTKGFTKYQVRMLTTGVHRDCQKVQDAKVKAEARAKAKKRPVADLDPNKVEAAIARKARRAA